MTPGLLDNRIFAFYDRISFSMFKWRKTAIIHNESQLSVGLICYVNEPDRMRYSDQVGAEMLEIATEVSFVYAANVRAYLMLGTGD